MMRQNSFPYSEYQVIESHLDHWWYRSLADYVLSQIKNKFGLRKDLRILDAGCGSAWMLRILRKHGYTNLVGLDANLVVSPLNHGLDVRKADLSDGEFLQSLGSFDLILCLDVLCHCPSLDDQLSFIKNMGEQLRSGGAIFIQVPALKAFSGAHDKRVGTLRRESKTSIRAWNAASPLEITQSKYRYFIFSPLLWLKRKISSDFFTSELAQSHGPWGKWCHQLANWEDSLPIPMPWGSSLFVVLERRDEKHKFCNPLLPLRERPTGGARLNRRIFWPRKKLRSDLGQ